MQTCTNAVIDPIATGHNIRSLRQERGLSVRDLQHYFNFDEPRAIYKWQAGQSLPSIDNLYALSALFDVPMDSIIIGVKRRIDYIEPQDTSCGSVLLNAFRQLSEAKQTTTRCVGGQQKKQKFSPIRYTIEMFRPTAEERQDVWQIKLSCPVLLFGIIDQPASRKNPFCPAD